MCFCSISCAAFLALSLSLSSYFWVSTHSHTVLQVLFRQTPWGGLWQEWRVLLPPVIIYYFKAPILQYHYHGVLVGSCTTDLYS